MLWSGTAKAASFYEHQVAAFYWSGPLAHHVAGPRGGGFRIVALVWRVAERRVVGYSWPLSPGTLLSPSGCRRLQAQGLSDDYHRAYQQRTLRDQVSDRQAGPLSGSVASRHIHAHTVCKPEPVVRARSICPSDANTRSVWRIQAGNNHLPNPTVHSKALVEKPRSWPAVTLKQARPSDNSLNRLRRNSKFARCV